VFIGSIEKGLLAVTQVARLLAISSISPGTQTQHFSERFVRFGACTNCGAQKEQPLQRNTPRP